MKWFIGIKENNLKINQFGGFFSLLTANSDFLGFDLHCTTHLFPDTSVSTNLEILICFSEILINRPFKYKLLNKTQINSKWLFRKEEEVEKGWRVNQYWIHKIVNHLIMLV